MGSLSFISSGTCLDTDRAVRRRQASVSRPVQLPRYASSIAAKAAFRNGVVTERRPGSRGGENADGQRQISVGASMDTPAEYHGARFDA